MINEPGQHSEGSQRKPQPTTLVRTLRCDQIETSLPLRTSGEASPEHGQEPRGGALLHLPASPGSTVRIQTMDTLSAIEGCDQLEVSPTTRRQSQILCRGAGRNGPGNVPSLRNSPEGIERIPDQGDMPLLQQGDSPGEEECGHRNGLSQQSVGGTATPADSDITSGRNDRAGRLPGLHGLPALAPNEGPIKPMTPKLERKLRAALKKAVAFWKQIQYILADMHDGDATLRDWINSLITNFVKSSPCIREDHKERMRSPRSWDQRTNNFELSLRFITQVVLERLLIVSISFLDMHLI